MVMIELNATTFPLVIERGTVLVSWYTTGCAPWRAFAPIYQAAALRHPRVVFGRIDADKEAELAASCAVTEIPTLMAFRAGALVFARAGFDVAESLDVLIGQLLRVAKRHFSRSPGKTPSPRARPGHSS